MERSRPALLARKMDTSASGTRTILNPPTPSLQIPTRRFKQEEGEGQEESAVEQPWTPRTCRRKRMSTVPMTTPTVRGRDTEHAPVIMHGAILCQLRMHLRHGDQERKATTGSGNLRIHTLRGRLGRRYRASGRCHFLKTIAARPIDLVPVPSITTRPTRCLTFVISGRPRLSPG